jgi:5-methyltetrahydrofolate--homocysteine methyltransferase
MASLEDLAREVESGSEDGVRALTNQMIADGVDPGAIINQGLIAGMNAVGVRFKAGDMFVPEVLMAAKAMGSGVELVKPLLSEADMPAEGKVLIGTVEGDLHDIGKNLVAMMMEGVGFTVVDLGVDISPEDFVEAVKLHKPDILGMSALLTTTMPGMEDTIEALEEEGLRDQVKIIIGGAPISQEFADDIGADGYAPDAASAADLCKQLLS